MTCLKEMKDHICTAVQEQLWDLKSADTKELGEAIDMIKDLAEAEYYCTITEAMEQKEPVKYYTKKDYSTNLEQYMRELSQDIIRMIEDATPEEREKLRQRLIALTDKINNYDTEH